MYEGLVFNDNRRVLAVLLGGFAVDLTAATVKERTNGTIHYIGGSAGYSRSSRYRWLNNVAHKWKNSVPTVFFSYAIGMQLRR